MKARRIHALQLFAVAVFAAFGLSAAAQCLADVPQGGWEPRPGWWGSGRPGYGPGMMGGYGPGMMHGRGPGRGMMGGGGPRRGMAYRALRALDLTDEQRTKVDDVFEEAGRKKAALAEKTFEARWKLHRALSGEKRDRKAIAAAYKEVSDLRYERLQIRLDARDKLDAILSKEQRDQLRHHIPRRRAPNK